MNLVFKHILAGMLLAWVGSHWVAGADPKAVERRCELAVIGGGSGGFGAALAAARAGVDVVLVERGDCLGGNSVRGGVNGWEPGAGGTGFPFELYRRLKAQTNAIGIYSFGRHLSTFDPNREPYRFPGGENLIDPSRHYLDTLVRAAGRNLSAAQAKTFRQERLHGLPFDPDAMANTMLAMLRETGKCRVLLNTTFLSAKAQDGIIKSVRLSNGDTLVADYFVDATGDGNVCLAVGCESMSGQEARDQFNEPDAPPNASARVNGVTLIYRVSPTNVPAIESLPTSVLTNCWWAKTFPVAVFTHYPNGDLNVNMLPTMDGLEFIKLGYRDAMEECRKRTLAHWYNLQTRYAEFRGYHLVWTAPALGIRESRRVVGEYVLTEHDLLAGISGQKHPDIICLADHAMDTHGSHSRSTGELTEPYGVPYRCIIPKGQRNLLIACRAASFSSLAASSCRLSRTMMQLGQAAGTAVAVARELKVDLPDVPPERLRTALRQQHVQLEHPMPDELRRYLTNDDGFQVFSP
ncbi:MAG: FAD-dependent oxidoreductase [Verrucomicrobiota bacterium]